MLDIASMQAAFLFPLQGKLWIFRCKTSSSLSLTTPGGLKLAPSCYIKSCLSKLRVPDGTSDIMLVFMGADVKRTHPSGKSCLED